MAIIKADQRYFGVTACTLSLGAAAAIIGLMPLTLAAFAVLVAVYSERGHIGYALGLVGCFALCGITFLGEVKGAYFFAFMTSQGFVMAFCVARKWTYARTVAATVAPIFAVFAAVALLNFGFWTRQAEAFFNDVAAEMDTSSLENKETAVNFSLWLKEQWPNVGLGITFLIVLLSACLAVSMLSWMLKRYFQRRGPVGSFATMRPPDWLVWVAIMTACMWLVDNQWPNATLRAISWNTALALVAIYWLNGLSILAYGVAVLRPRVLVIVALCFALMYMQPLVCFLGFFDTWSEFRFRLDALVAAKKQREDSNGEGPPKD